VTKPITFPVERALALTDSFGTYECKAYRERYFRTHTALAVVLAKRYVWTAETKGHAEANIELRQFHKKLTLGKQFQGLFIDSSDDDVKSFAKRRAAEIYNLFADTTKVSGLHKATSVIIKRLADCDLDFPVKNLLTASDEQLAAGIARCCDALWWRRQIRARQDIIIEHVLIEIGQVNRYAGIYASNHSVERKQRQAKRNMELLASLEAVNELGQVFNLLDIAQRGISNDTNRRNELMVRLSGFEAIANEKSDAGVFVTITAPSKFHSMRAKPCTPNPKYQGASPRDTHNYLNNVWKLIRAKLSNLKIKVYGVRVAEPHHDGTPHWHFLLFI